MKQRVDVACKLIFLRDNTIMKQLLLLLITFLWAFQGSAQITLECDFTSAMDRREPMTDHWDISNRISPIRGMSMPVSDEPAFCIVRPLGGKSKNGEKLIVEDTYKWDGRKYVYDWEPLKKIVNNVLSRGRMHQLLIDNPPWAFQRGIDLKGQPEVETYGNAWPPNDPNAWSEYIQAMLKELIKTYGKDEIEQWRFCIGREIGTKGHWRGTPLEFFEHYKNTENAIRAVLPDVEVGTHFLWASSKHSLGPEFVKWAKQNRVDYDFIGVSFYPFYNRMNRVDLEHVYNVDFAPIKDIPEWNPDATLEIHEFALISSMSKKGNSFDNAPKAHQESFTTMLGKMMYEHDMVDVFRWGTGENKLAEQVFRSMEGNIYYTSSKIGEATGKGNMVDAVFALDEAKHQYNILAYNYNAKPKADDTESLTIFTTLLVPPGTLIKYRDVALDNDNLRWSNWKTLRTEAVSGSSYSSLSLTIRLAAFSFQKIELLAEGLELLPTAGIKRVFTKRGTNQKAELELIDVRNGHLICSSNGRRFTIPISELSDEDVEFLKQWKLGE